MMTQTLRTLLSLSALAFVFSCTASHVDLGDPEANVLQVIVVSDLVPQHEVATIQADLILGGDSTSGLLVGQTSERTLTLGDPLAQGVDVAAFEGLDAGDYTIRVTCRRSNGEVVARNVVVLTKSVASMSVRVHVTRECFLVDCEQAGAMNACLAGRCVAPRCAPETPEFCPPDLNLFCETSEDCLEGYECVGGMCSEIAP